MMILCLSDDLCLEKSDSDGGMFLLRHQGDWPGERQCKSVVCRLFNWPQFVMCSLEPDQAANPNDLERIAMWTHSGLGQFRNVV